MEITQYNQVWKIWIDHKKKLERYIQSRFGNETLAEETVQEVLLKMYKSCCSGKEINNINSWLFQISKNAALDIIKKETRGSNTIVSEPETNELDNLEEVTSVMKPLISLLPEKYAVPLRMSDIENIPHQEISEYLNLGLSATKSRIQRARKLLKDKIISCFNLELDKNGIPISASVKEKCNAIKNFKK